MNAGTGAGAPPTPGIALRDALLGMLPEKERRRRRVRELSERLVAFVDAPSAGEKLDAWMAVVAWTRHGGLPRSSDEAADDARGSPDPAAALPALGVRKLSRGPRGDARRAGADAGRDRGGGGLRRSRPADPAGLLFGARRPAHAPAAPGAQGRPRSRARSGRALPVGRGGRAPSPPAARDLPSGGDASSLRPSARRSGSRFAWRSPTVSGCWRRGPRRRVSSARSARARRPPALRHRRSTGWPARPTRSSTPGSPAARSEPWRRNGASSPRSAGEKWEPCADV